MEPLELLKEKISQGTEEQLNKVISKSALKLSDEQIATVSFVFWLVYMAEVDLGYILSTAWQKSSELFSDDVRQFAKEMLQGYMEDGKKADPDDLKYFSDKIAVLRAMTGKNKHVELLYKLKGLRNDISHNRIDDLQYKGKPLSQRETKENILMDYFETTTNFNLSESKVWVSLSDADKIEIRKKSDEILGKGNTLE